jgi:hypothetical protein
MNVHIVMLFCFYDTSCAKGKHLHRPLSVVQNLIGMTTKRKLLKEKPLLN